jgi:hypothetical protein
MKNQIRKGLARVHVLQDRLDIDENDTGNFPCNVGNVHPSVAGEDNVLGRRQLNHNGHFDGRFIFDATNQVFKHAFCSESAPTRLGLEKIFQGLLRRSLGAVLGKCIQRSFPCDYGTRSNCLDKRIDGRKGIRRRLLCKV